MKKLIAAAVAAAGVVVLSAPALAHVTVQPNEALVGAFSRFVVRVPNERDDASTTKVTLELPPLAFVSFEPKDGWKRKDLRGGDIAYIDPSGLVGLRVNVAEFAGSDPLEHWRRTEEAQTRRDNPGYERVRMTSTTFRGTPAGYWEFTFDGKARAYRAVEMAFADADGTQYVVYLSAPDAEWKRHRPVFDAAVKGIRLKKS